MPALLSIRLSVLLSPPGGPGVKLETQEYVDLDDDPEETFSQLLMSLRSLARCAEIGPDAAVERADELKEQFQLMTRDRDAAVTKLLETRRTTNEALEQLGHYEGLPF